MSYMFHDCINLKNLNISSFDAEKVIYIAGIFYGCPDNIIESNKSIFKNFVEDELNMVENLNESIIYNKYNKA